MSIGIFAERLEVEELYIIQLVTCISLVALGELFSSDWRCTESIGWVVPVRLYAVTSAGAPIATGAARRCLNRWLL